MGVDLDPAIHAKLPTDRAVVAAWEALLELQLRSETQHEASP